jgi:hypothetical protein
LYFSLERPFFAQERIANVTVSLERAYFSLERELGRMDFSATFFFFFSSFSFEFLNILEHSSPKDFMHVK